MQAYGINNNLLSWVSSFLKDRNQKVRVNDSYSESCPVDSGIPQGSILGPLLFIIFINDLPDHVESCCKIFADDTKIYGSSSQHDKIQTDIYNLLKWSDTWQLKFNVEKCSVLYLNKK